MKYLMALTLALHPSLLLAATGLENYLCQSDGKPDLAVALDTNQLVMTLSNNDVVIRTPVRETRRPAQNWRQYTASDLFSLTFVEGQAPHLFFDTAFTCKKRP